MKWILEKLLTNAFILPYEWSLANNNSNIEKIRVLREKNNIPVCLSVCFHLYLKAPPWTLHFINK